MKIVLFDYAFERGKPGTTGLSDLVWNWAKHLVKFGDEVHIVAPYPENVQPPAGAIVHRFPLPPMGYRNIIGYLLIILRGWFEIQKLGQVDLVHAPEYLSTGLFALLSRRTPIVLTVPGNIYERIAHGNPFDWSMTQVLKLAARLSARFCACIIVTSEDMKEWWAKTGAPASRMVLIPHGIDTEIFHPIPNARSLLGISDQKRIILYVGRLSHEKGIHYLLEAVHSVRKTIPGVELHLVGDGPFKEQLIQLARQLQMEEQVIFHGWVDQPNLPLYYSAADVTVLPSLSEGLPRTMLEALACGSPFIGTRITGIVDHVRHGETGLLVNPRDIAALANQVLLLLQDVSLRQEIGTRAMEYVSQQLAWRVIVHRMRTEVYQRFARLPS